MINQTTFFLLFSSRQTFLLHYFKLGCWQQRLTTTTQKLLSEITIRGKSLRSIFWTRVSFYQRKTEILHILSCTCISDSFDALNIFKKEHFGCFSTVELYLNGFKGLGYARLAKHPNLHSKASSLSKLKIYR